MTQNEMVNHMASSLGISKTQAKYTIQEFTAMLVAILLAEGEVSIPDVGKIKVSDVAARVGRNPSTGESVNIAASKKLKFKPSTVLKAKVNA